MKINNSNYSKAMAKNGRLGGTQKGLNYIHKRRKCIELFISNSKITLNEIAKKIGVSQAFVSYCTNHNHLKVLRYSQEYDIQKLLKQYERIKATEEYKQIKRKPIKF